MFTEILHVPSSNLLILLQMIFHTDFIVGGACSVVLYLKTFKIYKQQNVSHCMYDLIYCFLIKVM
jgi:hypothetical protein